MLQIAVGVLTVVAIAAIWYAFAGGPSSSGGGALRVSTSRVAGSSATEFNPSISPDGQWIVYSMPVENPDGSEVPDIFLQSIDGQNPINLTETPDAAEFNPAYSPDGSQIVFQRASESGDGIYLMGRTGERVRLLAETGQLPAWSPDGSKVYVSDDDFLNPRSLAGNSQLHVIDVANGERQTIFHHDGWTAMQPSASPNGLRVAFWGLDAQGGQRDIWTIPATGVEPVAVTDDAFVDWNPIWSPQGDYLYFSSDRGGSMNIWRVAIDEATGDTLGEPEPLTSGGFGDQGFLSISSDGRRILYHDQVTRQFVVRAGFDPDTLTVAGDGRQLTRGPVRAFGIRPSPDGERIAYISLGGQQDLWIINADGSDEEQITDDLFKDWWPRWTPAGDTIYFYSDRDGGYDLWRIGPDGGGAAKPLDIPYDFTLMVPSPEGDRAIGRSPSRSRTCGTSGSSPTARPSSTWTAHPASRTSGCWRSKRAPGADRRASVALANGVR